MTPSNQAMPWVDPDYSALATRVQNGDALAERELCDAVSLGLRRMIARSLGACSPEVEDVAQDVMITCLSNLRAGMVRDPRCILGYIRTVMKRQIAAVIGKRMSARSKQSGTEASKCCLTDQGLNPEEESAAKERTALARTVLASLSPRDREIISRFYVDEQTADEICEAMSLTETEFRLVKSRAKAQFTKLLERKLKPGGLFQLYRKPPASERHGSGARAWQADMSA